jgi:hypothetical protein
MNTPTSNPALQIQTVAGGAVPSIYVEGVSQMLIGFPNCRMMFHNLSQKDPTNADAPEIRNMVCELIMPTAALIEMARGILSTMAANKETLEVAKDEWVASVSKLTSSL